jgi:hypothetical protein
MNKRFTGERIIGVLKEADAGTKFHKLAAGTASAMQRTKTARRNSASWQCGTSRG